MLRNCSRRIVTMLLLLGVGVLSASPALACGGTNCWIIKPNEEFHGICNVSQPSTPEVMHMGETHVIKLAEDRVQLVIGGFVTAAMDEQSLLGCLVALPPLDGVADVRPVTMREEKNGRRIQALTFRRNGQVAESASEYAVLENLAERNHGGWRGFLAPIKADVNAGKEIALHFEVILAPGATLDRFVASLREKGVLISGSANLDGTPNPDHIHYYKIGAGPISVVYPPVASGEPGTDTAPETPVGPELERPIAN